MAHGTQSWSKTSVFSSVEVKVEIRDGGGDILNLKNLEGKIGFYSEREWELNAFKLRNSVICITDCIGRNQESNFERQSVEVSGKQLGLYIWA